MGLIYAPRVHHTEFRPLAPSFWALDCCRGHHPQQASPSMELRPDRGARNVRAGRSLLVPPDGGPSLGGLVYTLPPCRLHDSSIPGGPG